MKFYKMNHQEKGALKMVYHERKLMSTKFLTWMDHNLKSLKEKRNYQSCPLICLATPSSHDGVHSRAAFEHSLRSIHGMQMPL